MWVIDLEAPPPRVRGLLSRWAVEVRAGMYVGSTTAKARDEIWRRVVQELHGEGNGVLIHEAHSAQGYEAHTVGPNRRQLVDVDGMMLATFLPELDAENQCADAENGLDVDPEYLVDG